MAAVATPSPSDIPAGTSVRKVLVVDIDGVRRDKVREASTPNLDALAARGVFSPTLTHSTTMAPTVSGPLHSTILTGVWADKHQVTGNDIEPNDLASYPDLLTRLRTVRPELSTCAVGDWPPLLESVIAAPWVKALHPYGEDGSKASALRTVDWAREALAERNPDVVFTYFIRVDDAGHRHGGTSPEYLAAIEEVDAWVGTLLDAVRARPTYAAENWLYVVATDHGHLDAGGHGGDEPEVRQIWSIVAGDRVGPGEEEVRMVDLAPTILAHLGVETDPAWNLDGAPIAQYEEASR